MTRLLLMVAGMALVTYLPRLLPMIFLQEWDLPKPVRNFLRFIPASAMGALIFPGILSANPDIRAVSAGGLTALLLAWIRGNILLVVAGAVLAVYLCLNFIPM